MRRPAAASSALLLLSGRAAAFGAFSSVPPPRGTAAFLGAHPPRACVGIRAGAGLRAAASSSPDLDSLSSSLNVALENCTPQYFKNCRVRVAPSPSGHRLGLVATEDVKSGDSALSVPYDDQIVLSAELATNEVLKEVLPERYDGWTGDRGLIALLVLNELAKASDEDGAGRGGIDLPKRKPEASALLSAWVRSLPSPSELSSHPLLWSEDDQEVLQGSSTKKIYRALDDVDEDGSWLEENVWSSDRAKFPETANVGGEERPCFSPEGFAWAHAVVASRSVFVDGAVRLIPVLDMANHDDLGTSEVSGGFAGAFGTTACAELRTARKYQKGEEVFVSYGPLSASEYVQEYGFVPARAKTTAVSELTFDVDEQDRFRDDKLDVLEFETYDSAPMDPVQKFDVVYEVGRDGEPDPAMVQFLRLAKLADKDAFLLESIFRKEVWGFMSLPVSEKNEGDVVEAIMDACQSALEEMDATESDLGDSSPEEDSPAGLCAVVREAERKALTRTVEYMEREKEALDLKEYYQERRLKDLGLDSEWSEDDADVGWGQTRAPGSGDLDW